MEEKIKKKRSRRNADALTPRQAKFVAEYIASNNGAQAAIAAGYSHPSNARDALKVPLVAKALEDFRRRTVEKGIYDFDMAMAEANDAVAFAKETGNANALVKAIELRAKLNGLLIEKHQHDVSGFSVFVSGIDYSKRDAIESSRPVIELQQRDDEVAKKQKELDDQAQFDEATDLFGGDKNGQ